MEITVKRVAEQATYTQGYMFINNEFFCDTMEAAELPAKGKALPLAKRKTYAIEKGIYVVEMRFNRSYNQSMPTIHVNKKDWRTIQVGNKARSLTGIIVGKNAPVGIIKPSRHILFRLCDIIQQAVNEGEVIILKIK